MQSVPYSVVSNLMNNLISLSSSDFGRTYGVADGLENIKSNIEYINSKLVDVDEQQRGDEDIHLWLRRFKPLILAADDLFDEIATDYLLLPNHRLNFEGKVRKFFSSSNLFVYCSQIARDLIETQKNVNSIVEGMQLLKLSQGCQSALSITDALSVTKSISNIFDVAFIGRDYEKRMIIEQLMQEGGGEADLDVIAIDGMGGIGKTTLAQLVYNDEQVRSFFQKQVWVSVSNCFDLNFVVKKILEALYGDRINDEQEISFKQDLYLLRQNLKDTKYLLVLDDVWNTSHEKWTEVRRYLMCGAQGSKILVTTRNKEVTNVMGVKHLNHISPLNKEDSLSLLKMLVVKNDEHSMIHAVESDAEKIVYKCKGLPFVIRSIAGMLCYIPQTKWVHVLNNILEMELGGGGSLISNVLTFNYDHLPRQLKECLIYCCVYPEGWKFEKNELIQLWMAQGYLQCSNDEQQMEDLGNEFVNTLLTMSFFVGKKHDEYGNLVSLEMPDLIYDLACSVAGNDFNRGRPWAAIEPVHMSLSMESYNEIDLSDTLDSSRLRTFFLQQANVWEIAQNTIELSVILTSKRLRVLNLSRTSLAVLPYSIGKLKHLRHLNLSWCLKLESLPKSIGNLVNLQTLKLTGCERLYFSTQVVTRLTNLRHLEIHRCKAFECMMPAGLGKLSSLQSLSNFHVVDDNKKKAGKLNELQNLNSLRGNLEINALDQVRDAKMESQLVNMKDKNLLESLDLNWENQDNIDDNIDQSFQLLENLCPHQHLKRLHVRWYPGYEFSNWLSSINHLTHISLFGFNNCKSLPPIEHLSYLKSLDIGSMKELEYIHMSSTAATFFQSLKRLKLSGCKNFKGWKRIEGGVSPDHASLPQFNRLSKLIINKCPQLTDLPTFPNVEELQLCESMVKPLKETLEMASSSSSSTPLSMLKSLRIASKFPDIDVLPSQWKQNLTSLEHLEIGDVDNLDIWFEGNFPSLQNVVVYGCDLKALPQKMCFLSSLQLVKMMGCHKLASLPKEMEHLTKLVRLEIWDCPLLVERCQRETGVDWPQISHVPNIIRRQNLRR